MSDRIVKTIELRAPATRVWRALTDHEEFGQWFRVKLDGPFLHGALSTGHMTFPGYEDYPWLARIETVEPESLFAFRWYHTDATPEAELADQPTTLVEFRLEPIDGGTRLTIIESGFESLPDPKRLEILRSNMEGWDIQAGNIAAHVGSA